MRKQQKLVEKPQLYFREITSNRPSVRTGYSSLSSGHSENVIRAAGAAGLLRKARSSLVDERSDCLPTQFWELPISKVARRSVTLGYTSATFVSRLKLKHSIN